MSTRKKALLFVVLFFSLLPAVSNANELTFTESLQRLYGVNETAVAAQIEAESYQYEEKAAIGLLLPKIYINGNYTAFDKDLSMNVDIKGPMSKLLGGLGQAMSRIDPSLKPAFDKMGQEIPDLSQTIQKKSFFTLDATAMWPIFTGGKIIAANKAAQLKFKKASLEASSIKEELGVTLAERYFSLRLASDVTAIRKDVFDAMERHYEKALKMEQAGVLPKVERMHAAVAVQEAKRAYETSLRDAKLAMAALKSILNTDEDITPVTPLFIISSENIAPLVYFQQSAVGGNFKLKQVQIGQQLAKVGVLSEISTFLPQVFLFGNAQLYNWQASSLMPDYTFGIGFSFNIFEGLSNVHRLQAAKSVEQSINLKKIRAEKDILTLVEQQYMTLENARSDYEAVRTSLEFTQEYLRARQKAFDAGLATSLDVVDAELALSKARLDAALAAYKFDTALAKLLDTAGFFEEFETYRLKASVELGL